MTGVRTSVAPDAAERGAAHVVAELRRHGFEAYLAGGCVRDRLRGVHPKDYDVATSARAEQVQALFPRTVPVGVHFGVVLVVAHGAPIEVATFRADAEYVDGRHPRAVRFTSAEEDAKRRDFTINGMFLDPETDEVIDYVGGQADLAAGVVRAIGDPAARLHEDRLRMLRAVRLAATLDFEIEPATFAAIQELAGEITDIAWERIGDEIVRMFTEGKGRRALALLERSGLLAHVLPEVAAMRGVAQPAEYHPEGDVLTHTGLVLDYLPAAPGEALALGALLHDVGKPLCAAHDGKRITFHGHETTGAEMALAICQRLRRSRDVAERVEYLVRYHLRPRDAPRMRRSTLRRFLAEDGIDELLALVRADALGGSGDLSAWEFCHAKLAELGDEPPRPAPLVRGRDLQALGYRPGPRYKAILTAVEDEQLEGRLTTRETALAWVQQEFPLNKERAAEDAENTDEP